MPTCPSLSGQSCPGQRMLTSGRANPCPQLWMPLMGAPSSPGTTAAADGAQGSQGGDRGAALGSPALAAGEGARRQRRLPAGERHHPGLPRSRRSRHPPPASASSAVSLLVFLNPHRTGFLQSSYLLGTMEEPRRMPTKPPSVLAHLSQHPLQLVTCQVLFTRRWEERAVGSRPHVLKASEPLSTPPPPHADCTRTLQWPLTP